MKNAIKLFAVSIFMLSTTGIFAQTLGVQAGLNFSTIRFSDDDGSYNDDFDSKVGFNAGLTAEFPIAEMFSIETGLLVSTKGVRSTLETNVFGVTTKATDKLNLVYLDIPINARVNIPIGNTKIFATTGPYIGIGLTGKAKSELEVNGDTTKETVDVSWGNDDLEDDFKRLDFGVSLGGGIQIRAVEVGISYAVGLANTSPFNGNGTKRTNRVLSVSVGYKFNQE